MTHRIRTCFPCVVLLFLAVSTHGQDFSPVGSAFVVNTYTTNDQQRSDVAATAGGEFVIVWEGAGPGDNSGSIFGRRFDSEGQGIGGHFQVNSYTTNSQKRPQVVALASGEFVVVWESESDRDGDGSSIHGRKFASEGTPISGEFAINTITTDDQIMPAVAAGQNGDFVVIWRDLSPDGVADAAIRGQRFQSNGSFLGGEFMVNSYTSGDPYGPRVAARADGDFVVTWTDNTHNRLRARRFASSGTAFGPEFAVKTLFTGYFGYPDIASDADGDFVIVWQEGDFSDITTRGGRFNSAGMGLGMDFEIESFSTFPAVAAIGDNQFAITNLLPFDSNDSVFVRQLNHETAALGPRFTVPNSTSTTDQPAVASIGVDNRFIVTWTNRSGPQEPEVNALLLEPPSSTATVTPTVTPTSTAPQTATATPTSAALGPPAEKTLAGQIVLLLLTALLAFKFALPRKRRS